LFNAALATLILNSLTAQSRNSQPTIQPHASQNRPTISH
jgi:hypothetical protein